MTIFLIIVVSNWIGLLPGVGHDRHVEQPHGEGAHGYVANGIILTAEAHEEEG